MAPAMSSIQYALEAADLDEIKAAMSFGRDVESSTQIINGVAVIPITGILRDEVDYAVRWGRASSYQVLEREYRTALDNQRVNGVMGYFDTPGGSAIGVKRLADLIFGMRGDKPLLAYVQGVCGSAGFYLAAAHDRIEATADSLVGSVGSIYPHMEMSGMLEEFGIGATLFVNEDSPKKAHGNIYEPLSDEAKETLQQFTDSYGRSFIDDVARYRSVTPDKVIASFNQGDALRADTVIKTGMIDAVVANFSESLKSISGESETVPVEETDNEETPVVTGQSQSQRRSEMDPKVKAQLFALGLIDSVEASDEVCTAALRAWYRGKDVPSDEAAILTSLRTGGPAIASQSAGSDEGAGDAESGEAAGDAETTEGGESEAAAESRTPRKPAANVQQAHDKEHGEARLADLRAAASLVNETAGYTAVTAEMVLDAHEQKQDVPAAMKVWSKTLADNEPSVPTARVRVTGEGRDRYAADVIDAVAYRALSDSQEIEISDSAMDLVNRPLWAIAGECLQLSGEQNVDMYGSREDLALRAMQMGRPGQRDTFYSTGEDRKYISSAGTPAARPGDFPNILSGLANKFLDTVQLDDDYSYPAVSAVLPGGLNDFKPAMMINKGIVEELDEVQDSEQFKQLGLSEEVLSYIFLRRFGNKWGWTPVMIANDDLGAFVEGMIGLQEAWQVTQNRLVVDRYTANETLLDSSALFADRTDVGSAANNNIAGGAAPSDAQWALMETAYADIGGVATGRRVRGTLNVCYCPTGAVYQAARRTFFNYQMLGETKEAATTANLGIYRGQVTAVPESELRTSSAIIWYALRNPTRLNTATVVRAYFNGFGTAGRRERWYDPTDKTTWVSIEGRVAVAVKNWRYALRNPGV